MKNTFEVDSFNVDKQTGDVSIHFYMNDKFNVNEYPMEKLTDFWKSCGKNVGYRLDHSEYRVSLFDYLITTFACDEAEVLQFLEFQFNNKA